MSQAGRRYARRRLEGLLGKALADLRSAIGESPVELGAQFGTATQIGFEHRRYL